MHESLTLPHATSKETVLARLTIADGLYLIVLIVAGIIRLSELARLPLSPAEAITAWKTWLVWQPEGLMAMASWSDVSPVYASLTSIIAQVAGFSDGVMRLVPAIFGLGLVALPWLWRRALGEVGALTTAVFLAVSPLNAALSRTVGGDGIALFALALGLTAVFHYRLEHKPIWLYVLAAAIAIGLGSSPLFYSGIFTITVAGLAVHQLGPTLPGNWIWPSRETGRQTAVFGLTFFLAITTLFLWQSSGLGAAAEQAGIWFGRFGWQSNLSALINPILTLIRYEIPLFLIAPIAILWASLRDRPVGIFCVYWTLSLLFLLPLQQSLIANTPLLTLPGYFLIGLFTQKTVETGMTRDTWLTATGFLLALALIIANGTRLLRSIATNPPDLMPMWILFLTVSFTLTTIFFLLSWRAELVTKGTLVAILIVLVGYQWGTGWWLSHQAANDPRERWVTLGTDDDIRLLVNVLTEISNQTTRSRWDLEIYSSVNSPVLAWYLRDFSHFKMSDALLPTMTTSVIITPVSEANPILGADYLGMDFGLLRSESQSPLAVSATPLLDIWRWWLFHDSPAPIQEERVLLWLRADLTNQ